MTFARFQALSPDVQLNWVLAVGTYLAERPSAEGEVDLFHLPDRNRGFFAEITYQADLDKLVLVRSFCHADTLAEYAPYVQLPEL